MKSLNEMTEIGETVVRMDQLIKETNAFEKLCRSDIEKAEEVIAKGSFTFNCTSENLNL